MSWDNIFTTKEFNELDSTPDDRNYREDSKKLYKALFDVMRHIKRMPGGVWTTRTRLGIKVNLTPDACWDLDNALILVRELRGKESK